MCLSIKVHRPDHILSEGIHLGYEWATSRNDFGFRCGYVRVPKGHPWHGEKYPPDADAHGGITFADADVPCDKGGPDDAWWLGFDCMHLGDAPDPELPTEHEMPYIVRSGVVRTQAYVEGECRKLCQQAKEAAG